MSQKERSYLLSSHDSSCCKSQSDTLQTLAKMQLSKSSHLYKIKFSMCVASITRLLLLQSRTAANACFKHTATLLTAESDSCNKRCLNANPKPKSFVKVQRLKHDSFLPHSHAAFLTARVRRQRELEKNIYCIFCMPAIFCKIKVIYKTF